MRRGLAPVAALMAALGTGTPAIAQETTPVVDRWAIGTELGLNAARGNSSYTMLSTGLRFTHLNRKQFEFDWASALTYGESNGNVIARRMSTTLRGDYGPAATWSPFIFGSVERDRIRRVDLLSNAGVGAKWTFFRNRAGAASLSGAGLYSYRSIRATSATTTVEPTQRFVRASLRPKIAQKYASGFSFEQTTFWQPEVGNAPDYNIDAATRLGWSPSKTSTLFTQYTYRFDSRPPTGVKREDQLMVAGIKLQF
ncbi:MAG TPA: DUF481 domain-containing protein [Gemmatimonadaceae bacterium]|nr:DUF481 domain-containing protein [Gemmatimonadaceae bacterium]